MSETQEATIEDISTAEMDLVDVPEYLPYEEDKEKSIQAPTEASYKFGSIDDVVNSLDDGRKWERVAASSGAEYLKQETQESFYRDQEGKETTILTREQHGEILEDLFTKGFSVHEEIKNDKLTREIYFADEKGKLDYVIDTFSLLEDRGEQDSSFSEVLPDSDFEDSEVKPQFFGEAITSSIFSLPNHSEATFVSAQLGRPETGGITQIESTLAVSEKLSTPQVFKTEAVSSTLLTSVQQEKGPITVGRTAETRTSFTAEIQTPLAEIFSEPSPISLVEADVMEETKDTVREAEIPPVAYEPVLNILDKKGSVPKQEINQTFTYEEPISLIVEGETNDIVEVPKSNTMIEVPPLVATDNTELFARIGEQQDRDRQEIESTQVIEREIIANEQDSTVVRAETREEQTERAASIAETVERVQVTGQEQILVEPRVVEMKEVVVQPTMREMTTVQVEKSTFAAIDLKTVRSVEFQERLFEQVIVTQDKAVTVEKQVVDNTPRSVDRPVEIRAVVQDNNTVKETRVVEQQPRANIINFPERRANQIRIVEKLEPNRTIRVDLAASSIRSERIVLFRDRSEIVGVEARSGIENRVQIPLAEEPGLNNRQPASVVSAVEPEEEIQSVPEIELQAIAA